MLYLSKILALLEKKAKISDQYVLRDTYSLKAMTDWGAEMVTLHGRSREQRYSKLADWKYIGECAEMLPQGMPVYGNGDIVNWEDYNQYRQTAPRVSGVMIAR